MHDDSPAHDVVVLAVLEGDDLVVDVNHGGVVVRDGQDVAEVTHVALGGERVYGLLGDRVEEVRVGIAMFFLQVMFILGPRKIVRSYHKRIEVATGVLATVPKFALHVNVETMGSSFKTDDLARDQDGAVGNLLLQSQGAFNL